VKELVQGRTICGFVAHGSKKFAPNSNAYYIKEIDGRVLMQPEFKVPSISEHGQSELLGKRITLKEMEALVEDSNEGRLKNWWKLSSKPLMVDIGPQVDLEDNFSFELESPKYASDSLGIFVVPPLLSFDSEAEGSQCEEAMATYAKDLKLASLCHQCFLALRNK
jgi:hypothetical protein